MIDYNGNEMDTIRGKDKNIIVYSNNKYIKINTLAIGLMFPSL
jgi:hypothetical protein